METKDAFLAHVGKDCSNEQCVAELSAYKSATRTISVISATGARCFVAHPLATRRVTAFRRRKLTAASNQAVHGQTQAPQLANASMHSKHALCHFPCARVPLLVRACRRAGGGFHHAVRVYRARLSHQAWPFFLVARPAQRRQTPVVIKGATKRHGIKTTTTAQTIDIAPHQGNRQTQGVVAAA